MQPTVTFTEQTRKEVQEIFLSISSNPYHSYKSFLKEVENLLKKSDFPSDFIDGLREIAQIRQESPYSVHVIRNCPIDPMIPKLNHDNPQEDKYRLKGTFVAEAMLASASIVWNNPIMSYANRFQGDYFTDVYAITRYRGKQTGYSDGELVYHNDRTAHPVRADYINLLGMTCPSHEYTCTAFVSAETLRHSLTEKQIKILSEDWFETPYDVVSKENNTSLRKSDTHPIFRSDGSIRYLDSHTKPSSGASDQVKDAFTALRDSLSRSQKTRHRLLERDLFSFPNQGGLHSREIIEPSIGNQPSERWLLKTYSLTDKRRAESTREYWDPARPLCVNDTKSIL